ncbi:hypothetical protein ACI3ER_11720 [Bacillus sp. Wb]
MIEKWLRDAINKEISETFPRCTAKDISANDFDMDVNNFKEAMKKIESFQEQMTKQPISIKANQKWFDEQVDNEAIIIDRNYKGMNKQLALFTGLPFTIDNTVDSYKFIYREEE